MYLILNYPINANLWRRDINTAHNKLAAQNDVHDLVSA